MEKKVARINWSRGKYSDVYRSTIVNPSPLRPGQKVKVLWGKTKKEHLAVFESYSIVEEQQTSTSQEELPQRRARAKRKLVGTPKLVVKSQRQNVGSIFHNHL